MSPLQLSLSQLTVTTIPAVKSSSLSLFIHIGAILVFFALAESKCIRWTLASLFAQQSDGRDYS